MATSCEDDPLVRTQIRDLIECTICLDIYTDPVALPCQHTFCRDCVDSILTRSGGQAVTMIPCPICRKEFEVPKIGLDGIEKDFKMNKLIGIYQSESGAVFSSCQTHKTKPLDVYCIDCRAVTCSSCFLAKHSGHRGSNVADSSDDVRKQLDQEIDVLSRCVATALVKQTLLRNEMFQFIDDIKGVELEINKRSDYLKQTIEQHRQMLIDDLSRRRQRVQREMEEKESELDECVEVTEKFKTRCCEMMLKASTTINDVCWDMNDTHARAVDLQQKFESQAQVPWFETRIKFEATNFDKNLEKCNIVGTIQDADEMTENRPTILVEVTPDEQPGLDAGVVPEAVVTTTLNVPDNLWSVAVLKDLICILCRGPTSIRFYRNEPPYVLQNETRPSSIANPWDLKASDLSSCLYITDRDVACVWKLTQNGRTVTKWLARVSDPYRVSVRTDGHVMIAKWGCPASIDTLDANGHLSEHLRLPVQILEPRDAVETLDGNVVISHRWRDTGLWGVSELTKKGHLLHRFAPTDDSQKLNFPSEMTVDCVGRVYVADYNNDRVILLSSKLEWNEILLTKRKDNIEKPRSLCFKLDQILVAHSTKISILQIKKT